MAMFDTLWPGIAWPEFASLWDQGIIKDIQSVGKISNSKAFNANN